MFPIHIVGGHRSSVAGLLVVVGKKRSKWKLTLGPVERNGRKTLTTVQGLPKKFDQKKILKVIKKKFGKFQPPMSDMSLWSQKLTRL